MCRDLGVAAIAEMVETKETVEMLNECGVQLGQGYLFGRPNFHFDGYDAPIPTLFQKSKK